MAAIHFSSHRSVVAGGRNAERGITLIEVLISLVVLSIAAIGIAGLQAYTTKYQVGIYNRTALSPLLNDLSGRMRANLSRVPGFDSSLGASAASYTFSGSWASQATLPSAPAQLCGTESSAVTCDAAQRATYDLWAWRKQVRETMPQGSALISGTVDSGLTVTFMWFDKDNTSSGTLRSVVACSAIDLTGNDLVNGQANLIHQTCCPAVAAAPDGVRCANFTVVP